MGGLFVGQSKKAKEIAWEAMNMEV